MTKIFNKSEMKERRRGLRRNSTDAEKVLWNYLRNVNIQGFRFKRQFSVEAYVLDFYCPKCKLAIELDGDFHNKNEQREYDKVRTRILNQLDIKVIRFRNAAVLKKPDNVLRIIEKNLV